MEKPIIHIIGNDNGFKDQNNKLHVSSTSEKDSDIFLLCLSNQFSLIFLVRCVRNKAAHFAYQLQKTMKGMGTDDDTLVRVVVSRCEIDMVQIKEEFQKMTGQTLEQYIAVSTMLTSIIDTVCCN